MSEIANAQELTFQLMGFYPAPFKKKILYVMKEHPILNLSRFICNWDPSFGHTGTSINPECYLVPSTDPLNN